MAYETSEIMAATALQKTSMELGKITKINQLVKLIKDGKTGKDIMFGDPNTKANFLKKMDLSNSKNLSDMAVGISAALAIRKYIRKPGDKLIVYMTGNIWDKDIADFQVNAYG